jgi:hypothetical protein
MKIEHTNHGNAYGHAKKPTTEQKPTPVETKPTNVTIDDHSVTINITNNITINAGNARGYDHRGRARHGHFQRPTVAFHLPQGDDLISTACRAQAAQNYANMVRHAKTLNTSRGATLIAIA